VDTGIERILEPISITAPDFREKLEAKGSAKAKASHIEYAIRQTIDEKIATDPAFYGSLKEQLEGIIEEDRKERKDEAKLLLDLMRLGKEEKDREAYARALGLGNEKEFSFYGLLLPFRKSMFLDSEEEHVAFTKKVILAVKDRRVIDWAEKEDIQREMRREIKRLLRSKGCEEEKVEPLSREILNLARIHFRND
jgi:type I restriction enzyme R subunit